MTNIGRPAMALYGPMGASTIETSSSSSTSPSSTGSAATARAALATHTHLWASIDDKPDTYSP